MCWMRWHLEGALNLLMLTKGMFDASNELLRAVADSFWLEWLAPHGSGSASSPIRAGVLVESFRRGRQGRVQSFWQVPGQEPVVAQASLLFDFDRPISWMADCKRLFSMAGIDQGPLSLLLDNILIWIDESWATELGKDGFEVLRSAVRDIAAGIWRDLVIALGFSSLLASDGRVQTRHIDRSRLNAARLRRGKSALLDHTEIVFTPSRHTEPGALGLTSDEKSGLRLHYVRGHIVKRGGKQFWRTAHLRGDRGEEPLKKTLIIRGGDVRS